MVYVITNCTEEDYKTLSTHLFKRQIVLLFKDGVAKVGVDLRSLFDLAFTAASLKCSFLFTPFGYEHSGQKYHTLKIVRDKDEDTNSRNRVLVETQGVRDIHTGVLQELPRVSKSNDP